MLEDETIQFISSGKLNLLQRKKFHCSVFQHVAGVCCADKEN